MPSSSCPILIQTVLRGILLLCLLTPQSGFPHPACGDEKAVDTTADAVPFADTDPASPWYPHRDFPHLKTSEWTGDAETKAVIVLAIDDMRDSAKYEQYLRPILNRLKQIDGRAPLSIMTNQILPADSQLQSWLGEGVTIECHTADHPCPLLNDGDLEKARSTYNRCVDQMAQIPGNQPVAFRTPCCDSLNTVSPRFFSEIFSGTTDAEQFLQIDSSVFMFYTSADPRHDRELVLNDAGEDRFLRYLPTANHFRGLNNDHFVNYVRDYPWPWVVNGDCWEIPCLAPSDWSAQHLQGVNNPRTLEDWKAAIDLTVAAEGCFSLVFHPHGWIQAEQVVELLAQILVE
ncbi:MAG: polysaccharide deacetylase family protein [Planctomycetaceae bacterium]